MTPEEWETDLQVQRLDAHTDEIMRSIGKKSEVDLRWLIHGLLSTHYTLGKSIGESQTYRRLAKVKA